MLFDPRAPLLFGAVVILLLGVFLAVNYPMPGELALPHGQIENISRLSSCDRCHSDAGLTQGCLSCHEEISGQLESRRGFHGYLLDGKNVTCTPCHVEHLGRDFPLTNRLSWGGHDVRRFQHPHVEFHLKGRHEKLTCEDCHLERHREPFALPRFPSLERPVTYLGLTQECSVCHEDIHAGGLSGACDACHDQEAFRPASEFDHSRFFPLTGGHERVPCARCHLIPQEESGGDRRLLPFDRVRGTICAECHDSPHRVSFPDECEVCHPAAEALWSAGARAMTAEAHALTGFRLSAPHSQVSCDDCHPPELTFDQKYPDPRAPGYLRREDTCEGCHEDAHEGQFQEKYSRCLDCHEKERFVPVHFGHTEHARAYPLTGAHGAVPCISCHVKESPSEARRFVGTSRTCKGCHEDPHGVQFGEELRIGDCDSCHDSSAGKFVIRPFDHEGRTGYPLQGAHADASCADCHPVQLSFATDGSAKEVRVYRGISTLCSSCHKDVHRGQFQAGGETRCDSCHSSTKDWRQIQFDHNTQSRFALDGVHAKLSCGDCHFRVKLPDGTEIVQYKPLGRECKDCHEIVPR